MIMNTSFRHFLGVVGTGFLLSGLAFSQVKGQAVETTVTSCAKINTSIKIEKSAYRLSLLCKGKPFKTYPVVFGGDPVNDKRQEGDSRTPEGWFKIKSIAPHKSWSYFIWIDYPTAESWKKHKLAKQLGEIPTKATIGGEIGIHGTPVDLLVDTRYNWTLGCIALKQADVKQLVQFIQVGTPVQILH
jgi:murein L,D-transpeptidase YafK